MKYDIQAIYGEVILDVPAMVWRIEAPHFVAGIEVKNDRVQATAPILSYMLGWPAMTVVDYCSRKNWQMTLIYTGGEKCALI